MTPSPSMGKPPSTLKEIARRAGVSTMTVSRALRAHADINKDTRRRILTLADQMGYRPDARMSELMAYIRQTKRPEFSGTLAILRGCAKTGDEIPHYVTNEIQISGAHRHANALGYKIDEFVLPFDGKQDRRMVTILKTRGIIGLIIYPPPEPGSVLSLDLSEFCPVVYSTNLRSPRMNRVIGNTHHAVRLSLDKLETLGYRRVGMTLYSTTNINTNSEFLPPFLLHNHQVGDKDRIPPLIYDDLEQGGYKSFIDWVERYRPEAVISHDTVALKWLLESGRRVPKDVGYVNLSQNADDPYQTSGVTENPGDMGSLLVDVVLSLVRSKEVGLPLVPRDSYSHATWKDGPTLARMDPNRD